MNQGFLRRIVVKNNQGTTLSENSPAAGRNRRLTDAGMGAITAAAERAADLTVVP
jgi:N-methylhydantoinase B/oxoprolinase/acetone carboxylase alpha subunit